MCLLINEMHQLAEIDGILACGRARTSVPTPATGGKGGERGKGGESASQHYLMHSKALPSCGKVSGSL